jgi:chemotaxis protein CheX
MDVSIINPFLTAAMNLYSNMFQIEVQAGAPYVLGEQLKHRWEISGILGLTGEYQGIVSFRLPRLLADKMLEKSGIVTKTEDERQETVYGMVGELTNIIAGNAASAISHASIDISPPVVVYGENHHIAWPKTIPVIAIPFTSACGPFEVDVCFKKK